MILRLLRRLKIPSPKPPRARKRDAGMQCDGIPVKENSQRTSAAGLMSSFLPNNALCWNHTACRKERSGNCAHVHGSMC